MENAEALTWLSYSMHFLLSFHHTETSRDLPFSCHGTAQGCLPGLRVPPASSQIPLRSKRASPPPLWSVGPGGDFFSSSSWTRLAGDLVTIRRAALEKCYLKERFLGLLGRVGCSTFWSLNRYSVRSLRFEGTRSFQRHLNRPQVCGSPGDSVLPFDVSSCPPPLSASLLDRICDWPEYEGEVVDSILPSRALGEHLCLSLQIQVPTGTALVGTVGTSDGHPWMKGQLPQP